MTPSSETAVHDPAPAYALVLDVDGPIASPIHRSIAIDSIGRDISAMANRGIPVIFNTGRSDAFITEKVIPPLRAAGLLPDAPVFMIAEKGAVSASVTPEGLQGLSVDEQLRLPSELAQQIRELIRKRFSDTMFFDETKRAMISVEQSTAVSNSRYRNVQKLHDDAVAVLLQSPAYADIHHTIRIDPTIISTDIEDHRLGKDLGAERALQILSERGIHPKAFYTMGDSRTDYAMADWLHNRGFTVAHVDVRPTDGIPETPYEVLTSTTGAIHDEAGAQFLSRWRQNTSN